MSHKKIVVIEKDKILKSILELFTEQLGYELTGSFLDFKESINFIQNNEIHTLIIDLNTFDNRVAFKDYIDLIESLDFPILFIGNSNDIDFAKKMISFNIYSFMSKPITKNILKINIEIAYSKHQKIISSDKGLTAGQSSIYCRVNSDGDIIDYDSFFYDLFRIEVDNLNGTPLKELLTHNQEFFDFKKFVRGIDAGKPKKSIFIHNDQVFESEVNKENEDEFLIYFNNSKIENELFYNNQNLKANFNTIFDNSTEGILIFDAQNYLVRFNDVAKARHKVITGDKLYAGFTFFDIYKFIPAHELESILETIRIPATHQLNRTVNRNGKNHALQIKVSPIYTEEIGSIGGYIVSSTELTKENQLQKEIETLKNELKPIYESTIQRFYLSNKNKKLVAFNEAALKIIQEEFNHTLQKGDNILQFVPKEIGEERFSEYFERALQGEHISFKSRIKSEIGHYWAEVHYEPVIDESGELNRVLVWTLDITESEKNLLALDKSNERYELIAKGGNDGLWDWDIKTNQVYLSPRWKNLLGYEDDEIENEFGVRDALTHPDDKERSEQNLKEHIESNSSTYSNELRLLCKDQNYKWVLERGIILRDENNKPYRLAGSITDITDRKESEDNLLELNRSLLEERAMFIKGNVVIIRADAHDTSNVTYVSDNTTDIFGYFPQEFYDKLVPFKEIIHPDDREQHTKERENAIKGNQSHIDFGDYRLVKKDGSIIWVRDFTSIIRNENGEAVSLLGYVIDITNEKVIEVEYDNIQNIFSAIWQALDKETFIVQNDGKILFSRNQAKYSTKNILENDNFIFDEFSSLANWEEIEDKIQNDEYEFTTSQEIKNEKIEIKVSKIDNKKILISTNIEIDE